MNRKKIGIVQTVNYIESYEHAETVCKLIKESELDGIRINLCKYRCNDIHMIIEQFVRIFVDNGIEKIYLDIPYPIDKARIYGITNGRKNIVKNHKYIIRKGSNSDDNDDAKPDEILINCNKINVSNEIIFYGDGEGAFKVQDASGDSIRCIALNDFYIINGKSISCGFYIQDKRTIEKILNGISGMKVSLLIPFVESPQQLIEIKKYATEEVSLIAKIETEKGIKNAEKIATECEAVLIGRGDLALYSDIGKLVSNLNKMIKKIDKRIIFCTGILQNFSDAYIPSRAELFDLLMIKEFNADELILSGTSDFNSDNINKLYSHSLKMINRKKEFIKNVW